MSVNTAHANNGVLIHAGEYILLHSDNVAIEFSGQDNSLFKGSKQGRIYLTTHRVIFNNKKATDSMQSFSAPFIALSDIEIEQPVFGSNYIKGKVRAQPNGNYIGEVKFKLYFKSGGAIEYGQALARAAKQAQQNFHRGGIIGDDPPPYQPAGEWHEAPPPAYQPPPGYYGWLPHHEAFNGPAPNTVFISDNPPPYPGISLPPGAGQVPPHQPQPYAPQAQGWAAGGYEQPPQFGGPAGHYAPPYNTPGFTPAQTYGGNMPPGGAYYPPQNAGGYNPPPQGGYNPPPQSGYNQPHPGGFGAPSVLPSHMQPNANNTNGTTNEEPIGAMGFSLPPPANSKEAEALASAPYNQQNGGYNATSPYDRPPNYFDLPPNYNNASKKSQ